MKVESKINKIVICLGSSCYSRGNNKNLEIINELIKNNELNVEVEISGNLCEDNCGKGPNLRINDKIYNKVDPNSITELLKYVLNK